MGGEITGLGFGAPVIGSGGGRRVESSVRRKTALHHDR